MDPFSIVIGAAAGGVIARLLTRTRFEIRPPALPPPRPLPAVPEATAVSPGRAAETVPLAVLSSYAKFHMGLYVALAVAYVALMASEYGRRLFAPNRVVVAVAVGALLLAGLAAAAIATNGPRAASVAQLMADRILPGTHRRFRSPVPTGRRWLGIEHLAFWCGIVAAVLSFNFPVDLRFAQMRVRSVSLDRASDGSSAVLEWRVPGGGGEFHKLADLGSDHALLVCVESEGGIEVRVDRAEAAEGTTKLATTSVGGLGGFACQGIEGRAVFAKSHDRRPQRGKLLVR